MRTKLPTLLAVALLAALTVGLSWAATPAAGDPAQPLSVTYFSNANIADVPDETVQLTNPGTNGGGNICAEIYVFYPDEEMAECCGCSLTPDDLLTLSVNYNLTSNPLIGVTPTSGVIKVVSATTATSCNPTKVTPVNELLGWGTHAISLSTGGGFIAETPFQQSALSATELSNLERQCSDILLEGSGSGVCSCGSVE